MKTAKSLVVLVMSVLALIASNAEAQLVTVKGATVTIKGGPASWTGVWADGTVDVNSGTVTNDGILTTTATYQIDASGTSQGSGLYKVALNWTNSGTFVVPGINNRSTVDLNGSSAQLLNGTQITTFNNLIFSGGGTKTLQQVEKIDSLSTYTSGIVYTTEANLLMYTVNAVPFAGGSSTSYVDGPCSRDFNSTTEWVYPVGKNQRFNKSAFTPSSSSSLTVRSEYFGMPMAYNPLTPVTAPLIKISDRHYWYFDPINPTTLSTTASGSGQVRLYWIPGDYSAGVMTNVGGITTARWTGAAWINTGVSAIGPGSTFNSGDILSNVTNVWLTPNQPFTIATTTTDNALPVELGGFAARQSSNRIKLNWFTYSEIHNLGFEIERADLGEGGLIASYKNDPELAAKSDRGAKYATYDRPGKDGLYTYNLFQVDANGLRKQIASAAVNYSSQLPSDFVIAEVFPNPTPLSASVRVGLQETSDVSVFVYDYAGHAVYTLPAQHLESGFHVLPLNIDNLPSGTYSVVTFAGAKQVRTPLVILR